MLQINMFCDAESDFQLKVYIQFTDWRGSFLLTSSGLGLYPTVMCNLSEE